MAKTFSMKIQNIINFKQFGEAKNRKNIRTPEQVEELRTAVDGLNAKVDSLTEALTKAGVLTVDTTPVGIDETTTPANEPETSFDDVLSELNRGRKY